MTIEVDVYGRNMEVTERIQDYADNKVAKLDRYLPGIDEVRVDVAFVKSARSAADRQVAQITVRGSGFVLRAEERADNIFAALDIALERIQRRIRRYKGKRYRGRGNGMSVSDLDLAPHMDEVFEEEDEYDELEPVIVRRKRFLMSPMDEMEAIEQMDLLGHKNFFVFFNAHSSAINVLYKRRDGLYGLIIPELG